MPTSLCSPSVSPTILVNSSSKTYSSSVSPRMTLVSFDRKLANQIGTSDLTTRQQQSSRQVQLAETRKKRLSGSGADLVSPQTRSRPSVMPHRHPGCTWRVEWRTSGHQDAVPSSSIICKGVAFVNDAYRTKHQRLHNGALSEVRNQGAYSRNKWRGRLHDHESPQQNDPSNHAEIHYI